MVVIVLLIAVDVFFIPIIFVFFVVAIVAVVVGPFYDTIV